MILNVRTNIFILGGWEGRVCSFTKIFSTVFSLSAAYGPVNFNILGKSVVLFVKILDLAGLAYRPLHNKILILFKILVLYCIVPV
jgi:hypothetical protein